MDRDSALPAGAVPRRNGSAASLLILLLASAVCLVGPAPRLGNRHGATDKRPLPTGSMCRGSRRGGGMWSSATMTWGCTA